MKVLLISGSFPPMKCGVGDYTYKLASNIVKESGKSIEVTILTSKNKSKISQEENVEFKILRYIENWSVSEFFTVVSIIKSLDPDIIHIQYPTMGYKYKIMPNLIPFIASCFTNKKVVQTWHEFPNLKSLIRFYLSRLTRDSIIVVEPNYRESLPEGYRFTIKGKDLIFIPVASNIDTIKLSAEKNTEIREKFKSINRNLVVYFGFASTSKGIEQIFKVANPLTDTIILICELNSSDPYHQLIQQEINLNNWKNHTFITGFIDKKEVAELLSVADVCMFPFVNGVSSRNASVLAARAQGSFIITTSREASGYIDKENTYYVKPNDISELRSALINIYPKNELQNNTLVSWENIAKKHIDLYEKLIS
jgi:glycosyltransferase involved in cell wall biosynthesis